MKLITKDIANKLSNNLGSDHDKPYLKLFNPCGSATWLISEYDPKTQIMFGLCDLGMGFPELGYVSLDEVLDVKLPLGLSIERDKYFEPNKTLQEYAQEARINGKIIA